MIFSPQARKAWRAAAIKRIGNVPCTGSFNPWRWLDILYGPFDGPGFSDERERSGKPRSIRIEDKARFRHDAEEQRPDHLKSKAQIEGATYVLELRPWVEEGNGRAIMEAVARCAVNGLVMPGWLAAAFVLRVQAVAQGEAREWSDEAAFGRAHPQNTNKSGLYAREVLAPAAHEEAMQLLARDPAQSIDKDGFYDAVGAVFDIGGTRAYELIQQRVNDSNELFIPLHKLRQLLQEGKSLEESLICWAEWKSWEMMCARSSGVPCEIDVSIWQGHHCCNEPISSKRRPPLEEWSSRGWKTKETDLQASRTGAES